MGRQGSVRRRVTALVAALATAVLSTACAADGPCPVTPPPSASPVTVPLSIAGYRLIAPITIGGRALRVVVDTGSNGLLLDASRVPPGVTDAPRPVAPLTLGSRVYTATAAHASLSLGSVTSAVGVPLALVTDSPRGHLSDLTDRGVVDGVLGVGTRTRPQLASPLSAFGNLGDAAVVHADPAGPSLELGAPADGFTSTSLRNHLVDLCVSSPGLPGPPCRPTLIDTGTPVFACLQVPVAPSAPIPPAASVTVSDPHGAWTLDEPNASVPGTGIRTSLTPPFGYPALLGLPALAHLDVRYDFRRGTIGFRSADPGRAAPPSPFRAGR